MADASNGITDPDKMAALSRIKKKLGDARGKKDELADENTENQDGLNGVKTQYNAINPKEDDLIDALGNTDKDLSPVDQKTKDTHQGAKDLLDGIQDLDAELEDFNKNARQGVLNGVKDDLNRKLKDLDDIEKRLKELETGITDTDDLIKDRKKQLDPEDETSKRVDDIAKDLGVLDGDT